MESKQRDRIILGMSAMLLALWAIACLWYPVTDSDIWWHLAAAKAMWAAKCFLRADPFSVTSLGTPWIDLHWGFQLVALGIWKAGGASGLVACKSITVLAAIFLAMLPNWTRRTGYFLIPLAAYGIYHVRFYLDIRPLPGTLFLLGAQYAVLQLHFAGRWRRPWLVLLPLQIILVNLQGLYLLGSFLVSALVLGRWIKSRNSMANDPVTMRPLLFTAGIHWFCGLISPYGLQGFLLPFSLFARITPTAANVFSGEIAENEPLLDLLRRQPGQAVPFLFFLACVLVTFNRENRRANWDQLLVFLAFGLLSLMAIRNLPLAYLAGLMAVGRNLYVSDHRRFGYPEPVPEAVRSAAFRRGAGLTAFLAILVLYLPDVKRAWAYEMPGTMVTPFRVPVGAIDFLEAHPIQGVLFNELRYGGYIEYRMYPEKLAFVDGRMILRTADFYRKFLNAVDFPAGFLRYAQGYGITHALLPISEDKRFMPLASRLLGVEGWSLLFCDGASVLLAAPGAAPIEALRLDSLGPGHSLRKELENRFQANPRLESLARINAAEFLSTAGYTRAAKEILKRP